jgi:hypothetical protein
MCLKALKAQQIRVRFAICAVNSLQSSLPCAVSTPVAAMPHKFAIRIESSALLPYLGEAFL